LTKRIRRQADGETGTDSNKIHIDDSNCEEKAEDGNIVTCKKLVNAKSNTQFAALSFINGLLILAIH